MRIIESIKSKFIKEAAEPKLSGRAIFARSSTYTERPITADLMATNRSVPPIMSALSGLSRLCFAGFDFVLLPLDEGDDGDQKKMDDVKAEMKRTDARIGRVGKQGKVGTLGLVRGAFLDGCTYRQAVVEFATAPLDGWTTFSAIQLLPGISFSSLPSQLSGQERYVPDALLRGIVYDSDEEITRFWQGRGAGQFVEIPAENVLYLEDSAIPADTSMMKSITPTVEQWKEVRKIAMLAEGRVGVPNETVQIDGRELAEMAKADIKINHADLQAYATKLLEGQSYDQAQLSIAGMKLQYPNIPIPLNPWEADQYLKTEVLNFFFGKDITEQLAQAISVSASPAKALLDARIASERELWGRPFEGLWNQWLEWNGYDLRCELAWLDWTPADKEAEANNVRADLAAGMILIDEARALRGYGALDTDDDGEDEREKLYEEIAARRGISTTL